MQKHLLQVAAVFGVTGIVAATMSGSLLPIAVVIGAWLLTREAARFLQRDD